MVIGIYPRKSVYRDNSDSVQVQIRMCREYAEIVFRGQELEYRIYDQDEGFSGKNTNRPGFQELMTDVRAGLLDAVVVYRLDRISRNVREFSAMYEVFQQHNVAFISVKESFDTSTPMGRTVMYILAAFAQLERENTSERVTDNMHALGAAGKWTGGRCPAGMTSVRRAVGAKRHSFLVVDKNTIDTVKLLYSLILQGYTITGVERYCRDHGIHTQTGKFLNSSQIYNILTNPVYCQGDQDAYDYFNALGCQLPESTLFDGAHGLIGYGKTRSGEAAQKRQGKDKWAISVGIHEPVISSADWIAVQSRLGINKMVRTAKYQIGILKGVLRCRCGARMEIRTYCKNGSVFSYYYCSAMSRQGKSACDSGYFRVDQVEDAFLRELHRIRFNPAGFSLRQNAETAFRDISEIRQDLRTIQDGVDNLTSALMQAQGSSAASYIITRIEELDRQKKSLEAELRKARCEEKHSSSLAETEKIIYENICYLLDNFEEISYSAKNELIRKVIQKCIFDGENLKIIF